MRKHIQVWEAQSEELRVPRCLVLSGWLKPVKWNHSGSRFLPGLPVSPSIKRGFMSTLFLRSGWYLVSTSFATLAPLLPASPLCSPEPPSRWTSAASMLPPNGGPQSCSRARLGAEPTGSGQRGLGRGEALQQHTWLHAQWLTHSQTQSVSLQERVCGLQRGGKTLSCRSPMQTSYL